MGGGFAYGGARRMVAQPRYTIGQYAQKGYESRHVTDEKLNNLKEVRAACGLQHIPVSVGLQTFRPPRWRASSRRSCSRKLTWIFLAPMASARRRRKCARPSTIFSTAIRTGLLT